MKITISANSTKTLSSSLDLFRPVCATTSSNTLYGPAVLDYISRLCDGAPFDWLSCTSSASEPVQVSVPCIYRQRSYRSAAWALSTDARYCGDSSTSDPSLRAKISLAAAPLTLQESSLSTDTARVAFLFCGFSRCSLRISKFRHVHRTLAAGIASRLLPPPCMVPVSFLHGLLQHSAHSDYIRSQYLNPMRIFTYGIVVLRSILLFRTEQMPRRNRTVAWSNFDHATVLLEYPESNHWMLGRFVFESAPYSLECTSSQSVSFASQFAAACNPPQPADIF